MSIATVTAQQVQHAITACLDEVVDVLVPCFGEAPVARLLNLPREPQEALAMFLEASSDGRDPNRYAEGVAFHASSLWAYAWKGDNAGGQHPVDSWPEIHLLGQVVSALDGRVEFDLSFRNGSVFGDSRVGDDRAVDIVKWVVDAYKARGRIDFFGGDISIEELAALARVSEKTLRMAANPKNAGALRTIKRGHRTFVTTHDAMEWLSRRPDFVPTQMPAGASPGDVHMGGDADQLRAYLAEVEERRPEAREMAADAGLTREQCDALFSGEPDPRLDAGTLVRFANRAGFEEPTSFARWVLEIQFQIQVRQLECEHRKQVAQLSPKAEGEE